MWEQLPSRHSKKAILKGVNYEKIQICIFTLLLLSGCGALSDAKSPVSLDANSRQQSEVRWAKDTVVTSSQPDERLIATLYEASKPIAPTVPKIPSQQPLVQTKTTSDKDENPIYPTKPEVPMIQPWNPSKQPPQDAGVHLIKFVPYDTASLPKLEQMQKQRKIKDLDRFESSISYLKSLIEQNLDYSLYAGVEKIRVPYQNADGYLSPASIGVRVYYTDLEVAKAAVKKSLDSIDQSVGKIDVEYQKSSYSGDQMGEFSEEIAAQPFFDYDYDSCRINGAKIHVVMGFGRDTQKLKDFLRDKPYRDMIVVEKKEEQPYYRWVTGLKNERGIPQSDSHRFTFEISKLVEKLNARLDKTTYGGVESISEEFYDAETGQCMSERIGIKIYYIDYDAVSTVVQKCWQEIDHGLGKIDIEYVKCDNSLEYLELIAAEIEQEFEGFSKYVSNMSKHGGKLHLTYWPYKSGDELRDFLSDKPYRDNVTVRKMPINPAV